MVATDDEMVSAKAPESAPGGTMGAAAGKRIAGIRKHKRTLTETEGDKAFTGWIHRYEHSRYL